MNRQLNEIEFTIFDTETTGLNTLDSDRIVEIAAIRIKGDTKIGEFNSLINPQRDISAAAFAVNHITNEMVKDAPLSPEILPRFMEFIKGSCLCSYNAIFDVEFLKYELELMGKRLPADIIIIDILKMARKLIPGQERYALWYIAEKMGIAATQEHRAFSDVGLTLDLFSRFLLLLIKKEITDFKSFTNLFSINMDLLNDLNNQKIAEIQEAIDKKIKLKLKYISTTNAQISERVILPREMRQENKSTYVFGYCYLRNDERSFKVDNILKIELLP